MAISNPLQCKVFLVLLLYPVGNELLNDVARRQRTLRDPRQVPDKAAAQTRRLLAIDVANLSSRLYHNGFRVQSDDRSRLLVSVDYRPNTPRRDLVTGGR